MNFFVIAHAYPSIRSELHKMWHTVGPRSSAYLQECSCIFALKRKFEKWGDGFYNSRGRARKNLFRMEVSRCSEVTGSIISQCFNFLVLNKRIYLDKSL